MLNKIKEILKISWFKTIYFNFHYFPINIAYKLPVLLYKPKLLSCKGTLIIDSPNIKTGMIKLGISNVSLYANVGIVWENLGGKVVFKGSCIIGNASNISIAKTGNIEFGNDFVATSNLKICSYCSITFSEHVRVAWETIILDTSFHFLKDKNGNNRGNSYEPIYIGSNNWITIRCVVLKGTRTPDYCIFGSGSILNKDYSKNPTHILMAGNPLEIKATGIWRDMSDDSITYQNSN